jgi:hypothetical protein
MSKISELIYSLCISIVNVSGYFYNERHLFITGLVNIVMYWMGD